MFTKVVFPKFCNSCGQALFQNCPHCNAYQNTLSPFCSECGTKLYQNETSGVAALPAQSSTQRTTLTHDDYEHLKKMDVDQADIAIFIEEMYRVMIRFNPVHSNVYTFSQQINSIQEGMENETITEIVRNALNELEFSNIFEEMNNHLHLLKNTFSDLASDWDKTISKLGFPSSRQASLPDYSDLFAGQANRCDSIYNRIRPDIEQLLAYQNQLIEFYPRYEGILNSTGIWDMIFGFASGFFGGGLGVLGRNYGTIGKDSPIKSL